MKKNLLVVLLSFLFVSCLSCNIFADDSYVVSVDGGMHGTSDNDSETLPNTTELVVERNSQTELVLRDSSTGTAIFTLNVGTSADDAKYYLKGVHYAGQYLKDSDLIVNVPVDQDLILVASYGVTADQVAYNVTYRDTAGNDLLPMDTFYANNTEKVLVAAKYIDGYTVSNARSYTGTINKDNPTVSFDFIYVPVGAGGEVIIDDGTTYIYEEGEGGATGGGGGGGVAPTPTPTPTPEEVIDIDEPEVPQTEPENNEPGGNTEPEIIEPEQVPASAWEYLIEHPFLLGGGVVSIGLLLWLLIFLFTRKKEVNE